MNTSKIKRRLLFITMICMKLSFSAWELEGQTTTTAAATSDDHAATPRHDAGVTPKDVVARGRNVPNKARPRAVSKIPLPPRMSSIKRKAAQAHAVPTGAQFQNGKLKATNQAHATTGQVGSSLSAAHRRGTNTAIIGGPTNTEVKNAGVVNGTHMPRKP